MDISQVKAALGPLAGQVDLDAIGKMLSDPGSINLDGLKRAFGELADKLDMGKVVDALKSGNLDALTSSFAGITGAVSGAAGAATGAAGAAAGAATGASSTAAGAASGAAGGLVDKLKGLLGR